MTVSITVPTGLTGVNSFSTEQWWDVRSPELLPDARIRTVEAPGTATVLVTRTEPDDFAAPDSSPPVGSVVLMIMRPVRDWLLDGDGSEPVQRLKQWGDAVLSWTAVAPIELVVSRHEPGSLKDLKLLAYGQPGFDQPAGPDRPRTRMAEEFASTLRTQLQQRRPRVPELQPARTQAAIDAVVAGTGGPTTPDARALQAAAREVRARLVEAGVRIRGPRTALDWPGPPSGSGLSLEVAAEASLAVLLAETYPVSAPTVSASEARELADQRRVLHAELRQTQLELVGRRKHPANLRRLPLRAILRQLVVGKPAGSRDHG
jgi:hypothetical protein